MKREMMKKSIQKCAIIAVLAAGLYIQNAWASTIPTGISVDGMDFSGKTTEEAKGLIDEYIQRNSGRTLRIKVNGQEIASTTLKEFGYEGAHSEQVLRILGSYNDGNLIKRYMTQEDMNTAPVNLDLEDAVDQAKFDQLIKEKAGNLLESAQDAKLERKDGKFVITPEKSGVKIDEEKAKTDLEQALHSGDNSDIVLDLQTVEDKPKITADQLSGIKDVLGTFTTDYSSSSSERATNVKNGAQKINGHILMPGETLSGYECMEPFTVKNGYRIAHAYENGQVVDSIGGGACQIATTLYNAALRAELKIKQRQNHSMTVGYVQPSGDAAIAGTYKDIKITNNQDKPIYVEAYTTDRKLTFTIWGTETRPANRTLEFESKILSKTKRETTYIDDERLSAGEKVYVSSGHDGRVSQLWKIVKVNGVETERKKISEDYYITSNDIVRRGVRSSESSNRSEEKAEKKVEKKEQPATPAPQPAPAPEPTQAPAPEPTQAPAPEPTQAPETQAPAPQPAEAAPGGQ